MKYFRIKARAIYLLALSAVLLSAAQAATEYTTASESASIAVSLKLDAPASYFDFNGTTVSRKEPGQSDTHYLIATVKEAKTGAALPGCKVTAAIDGPDSKSIGTSTSLVETWDRTSTQYGANIQLPAESTTGSISLKIEPPRVRYLNGTDNAITFTKPIVMRISPVSFARISPQSSHSRTTQSAHVEWPEGRRPYATPTPYPGSRK